MKNKNYNNIQALKKEAELCTSEFRSCYRYMEDLGIIRDAQRSVNMYEGRQYQDYKNLKAPFDLPVLNLFQNIIDGKAASVCSKEYKLNFVVENNGGSTYKLEKFTDSQMKELKQKKMYKKQVLDTLLKGTGLKFDYWNTNKIGVFGDIEGGLDTSIIDVADFAVSNPRETDIQKQEWIIIRTRENINAVKQACDTMGSKNIEKNIISNQFKPTYNYDTERKSDDNVYSYIKFFRQDNEVYFEKFTEEILYQFPRALNPKINEKKIRENLKEEEKSNYENETTNNTAFGDVDPATEQDKMANKYKANKYPITRMVFYERDHSFYGVSYGAQLIAIQKQINELAATTLITARKSLMPTIVVKHGALGTQKVDFSKPNGVITDYSGSGVNDAIKILSTGTFPTTHYELAQSLTSFTKDIYRANDILNDGRQLGANASGALVANLKALQDSPVQQWQEEYCDVLADEGKIIEMFFKSYYHNKPFTYEITDRERQEISSQLPTGEEYYGNYITDIFDGDDYVDKPFNISVIVSETSKASEATSLSIIETLFLNGVIANLSYEHLDMLTTLLPENVFPQKDEFKRMVRDQQNNENAQLKQQLQQQVMINQQLAQRSQAVEQEFANKINANNENLRQLQSIIRQLQSGNSNKSIK